MHLHAYVHIPGVCAYSPMVIHTHRHLLYACIRKGRETEDGYPLLEPCGRLSADISGRLCCTLLYHTRPYSVWHCLAMSCT